MNKLLKSFLVLSAFLLYVRPAHAAPSVAGTTDYGNIGGQHYYAVYFTLDNNTSCYGANYSSSTYTEAVSFAFAQTAGFPFSITPVTPTYTGVSGYSPLACQINVAAPYGSGIDTLSFTFGEFSNTPPTTGTQVGSGSAGGVTLSF